MKKNLVTKLCLFLFIFSIVPAFASYNRYGVPDSSEIRKDLIETWFEAPLLNVRLNRPEIRTNKIGEKFQIRLEETDDYFTIFVSPHAMLEVDVYSDKGKSTEMQDIYPGDAVGSWILVRDKKTGNPIRIRYYFAEDSEVYVQFFPNNKMAYADLVIYGNYAAKGVSTGVPFSRFFTSSFESVVKWTSKMIPWEYTKIYRDNYPSTIRMINTIQEKMKNIVFTEDAMYDENIEPVYISSGKPRKIEKEDIGKITVSGAGFLKWIADGIIEPITGGRLKREPLIVQTVEYKDIGYQGILSESYALSFSLDWIRNLASAIVSVRSGHNYMFNESGVDVDIEPFAARFTEQGIKNTEGYIHDSGYSVQSLKALLYVLAAIEPETFYFGAIRETHRKTPEVKVFNECVALFPYFDSEGHFQLVIFKDGTTIPYDEFFNRYCLDTISLVKVRATNEFYPD